METRIKQAIVIRKDLSMRRGKEIAQGSHASMAFLVRRLQEGAAPGRLEGAFSAEELAWMRGGMAKICLQVDSEEDLLRLHGEALKEGLAAELIRDSGRTEFGGVPTLTCLAVGPDAAEKLDRVTGGLRLY